MWGADYNIGWQDHADLAQGLFCIRETAVFATPALGGSRSVGSPSPLTCLLLRGSPSLFSLPPSFPFLLFLSFFFGGPFLNKCFSLSLVVHLYIFKDFYHLRIWVKIVGDLDYNSIVWKQEGTRCVQFYFINENFSLFIIEGKGKYWQWSFDVFPQNSCHFNNIITWPTPQYLYLTF